MKQPLDIRDISIIDAFPTYDYRKIVLNVGCGKGRIDSHLCDLGYFVHATDFQSQDNWLEIIDFKGAKNIMFTLADIFKLESFPVKNAPVVICSETLEHLTNYKEALKNLLALTSIRLIITVPWQSSFNVHGPSPKGHCNHWSDKASGEYKDIHEFEELCKPYSTSISKIRTKPEDVGFKQYGYLIVVDKRQGLI